MKKFFSIILSLLIIALGFGTVIVFEMAKDKVNQTPVLVAKEKIPFKEKITEDLLTVTNIPSDLLVDGVFKPEDMNEIIGTYAAIDIPKGAQIHKFFLDSFDLVPNEKQGEFIAPIPSDWLFAVPQSLRKSYLADFYVISSEEQQLIDSMNWDEEDEQEKIREQIISIREPILKDIRVSSVKDSSNKEVVDSGDDENMTSGRISTIEIIANQTILDTLRDYTEEKNYKLYIVYDLDRNSNIVQESEDDGNER